jgi:tRNA-guanine family transglycosylase
MAEEILASRLATTHNLFYFLGLMQKIRESIIAGNFLDFKANTLGRIEAPLSQ